MNRQILCHSPRRSLDIIHLEMLLLNLTTTTQSVIAHVYRYTEFQ